MKENISLIILVLLFYSSFGQESSQKDSVETGHSKTFYIGAEAGMNFYSCSTPEYDFIRALATNTGSADNTTLNWYFTQSFFNAVIEFRLHQDKFWVSTGLRYSGNNSSLGNLNSFQKNDAYFYFLLEDGNIENTHSYRILNISEQLRYLGIPISIRFSPYKPRFFRLYFKLGVDLNVLIEQNRKVAFYDNDMDYRQEDVLANFSDPADFYSTVSLGIGVQLGKQNHPNVRLEANVPTFLLSQEKFSLVNPNFGGGFNVIFVYPIKSK
jgi:hypothetical protein